jgi:ATP-binding cassette subfamily G (WHITE) protein 2 (PDR)
LGILVALGLFFCTVHLLAAEYIQPQASKGEILLYRHAQRNSLTMADEESPAIVNGASSPREMVFVPSGIEDRDSIIHWQDLCFDIETRQGTKRLLSNVSGWVKQGTLTALMGVTGAGKTTLLDVLADRTTVGVIRGGIFVNGEPRAHSFQRETGYVQQQDLHLPTATIREALEFSAIMRQPGNLSRAEKLAYVEQRKRLTIAVEMVAKPELLLFLGKH